MASPTPLGTAAAILVSVVAAALICFGITRSPFKSGLDSSIPWSFACGTSAARLPHTRLPSLCLADDGCSEPGCCPSGWLEPVEPGELLQPGLLEPRRRHNPSLTSSSDIITAYCVFVEIDLVYYTADLSCVISFWGRFNRGWFVAQPWPTAGSSHANTTSDNSTSNVSLVLLLGLTRVELKNNDLPLMVNVKLNLGAWWSRDQVNAESYPDVKLQFDLIFAAFWWNGTANQAVGSDDSDTPEPPFVVQLGFNYIPPFLVDGLRCSSPSTSYDLSGLIQLSGAARAGVRLLNGCMWCLAAATLAMSFVWCMLRKPDKHLTLGLTGFSATLLFALPSLRGLLPAAPVAGTSYDALNVHGQLALVTASILLQVAKMLIATVNDEWRRQRRHNKLQQQQLLPQPVQQPVQPSHQLQQLQAQPDAALQHQLQLLFQQNQLHKQLQQEHDHQQVVSVLSSWMQPVAYVRRCLRC